MNKVISLSLMALTLCIEHESHTMMSASQRMLPYIHQTGRRMLSSLPKQTIFAQQAIPRLNQKLGYQSRQFVEPTTLAAAAAAGVGGWFGFRPLHNYFKNQYNIYQAKGMLRSPQSYGDSEFEIIMDKLASAHNDNNGLVDFNGKPFGFANSKLLDSLATARINRKQANLSFYMNHEPYKWLALHNFKEIPNDIFEANKYNHLNYLPFYSKIVIPDSILRGIKMIEAQPELKRNFIKTIDNLTEDTKRDLYANEGTDDYAGIQRNKMRMMLKVLDEINQQL